MLAGGIILVFVAVIEFKFPLTLLAEDENGASLHLAFGQVDAHCVGGCPDLRVVWVAGRWVVIVPQLAVGAAPRLNFDERDQAWFFIHGEDCGALLGSSQMVASRGYDPRFPGPKPGVLPARRKGKINGLRAGI